MSNPVLPASFLPVAEGYSFTSPEGVQRTAVAGGMPRYAMQYDRGVQDFKITMVLSLSKFTIWNIFYFNVIKKGSISFDMQLDSGLGVMTHTCNIVPGTYNATLVNSSFYSITFTVEAESSLYSLSSGDAQSMLDLYTIYGSSYDLIFSRIEKFSIVDTSVLT